ncbi:UPF0280 family protein [uncultured Methanobrevibacter sp.]|uniref:UPF0280 family protein n=1 Tax=uncultured Methanobrevibacter sp. TaxID=253161 RepID=UPI0025DFAE21|nr:UPF0280 family protein [uncultured Methanobrevibacter sp.]
MNFCEINLGETHIRLTTDLSNHSLEEFILNIRFDLKKYINQNNDFLISLQPVSDDDDDLPLIVKTMLDSSKIADVGPMACVAGSISELSLNYLINNKSSYSIVENGGDIALVNDKKVLCGIYSNNKVLENNLAFVIKPRRKILGICTSSGRIGHSISFGESDSVTVLADSPSVADGLATNIANEVKGDTSEDSIYNALNFAEEFREFFNGLLIVCDDNVATMGKLPKIIETNKFQVKL